MSRFVITAHLNPNYLETQQAGHYFGIYLLWDTTNWQVIADGEGAEGREQLYTLAGYLTQHYPLHQSDSACPVRFVIKRRCD